MPGFNDPNDMAWANTPGSAAYQATYISPEQYAAQYQMSPGVVLGAAPGAPPVATPGKPYYRPDGTIYDPVSGVSWSRDLAPQDVLDRLGTGLTSQRPADAATLPGQTAPPIVGGVVKTNLYGNPTAGERAGGMTDTTGYPLPATPGVGINPVASTPGVGSAGAAAAPVTAPPRSASIIPLTLPTGPIDTTSPSSIFRSYLGLNGPGLGTGAGVGTAVSPAAQPYYPVPFPSMQPRATVTPPAAARVTTQSVAAPAGTGAGAGTLTTQVEPRPQVSMKPAPSVADTGLALGKGTPPPPGFSQAQWDAMQSTNLPYVTGTPAFNAQAATNAAALAASNAAGSSAAAGRVWGQYRDPEDGSINWGWVNPADALNTGAGPNPRPDLAGVTAGQYQATQPASSAVGAAAPGVPSTGGTQFRVLSAYGGGPVYGGGNPNAPGAIEGGEGGALPPVPVQNPEGSGPPNTPPTGGTANTDPLAGYPDLPGLRKKPEVTTVQQPVIDPVTRQPVRNPDGTIQTQPVTTVKVSYEADPNYRTPAQVTTGALTDQQISTAIDGMVANTSLTQEQIAQLKALLPGKIDLNNATIDQIRAAIANTTNLTAAQVDQINSNLSGLFQGAPTLAARGQQGTQTGYYIDQSGNVVPTLAREEAYGFGPTGTPTLAALKQQEQNAIDYAASQRADYLAHNTVAGTMGVDENGNPTLAAQELYGYGATGAPTLARETTISSEARANLLAQASIGNMDARLALDRLAQQEGQREFDIQNEQAWRQNPSSIFDRIWNNRATVGAPGAPTASTFMAQPLTAQTAFSAPGAPGAGGTVGANAGAGASQPQYSTQSVTGTSQNTTAPANSAMAGPLTRQEIAGGGAEAPAIAAAFNGGPGTPAYTNAGGVPNISLQKRASLSPSEMQATNAELSATGNSPADYWWNQNRMRAQPVRSGVAYGAPRPTVTL